LLTAIRIMAGQASHQQCLLLSGLRKITTTDAEEEPDAWRPKYVFHYIQDRYYDPRSL
jgi:hypothetical protein